MEGRMNTLALNSDQIHFDNNIVQLLAFGQNQEPPAETVSEQINRIPAILNW